MAILSKSEYDKIDRYYYGRKFVGHMLEPYGYLDLLFKRWNFAVSAMSCDDGYGAEVWYNQKVIAYFFGSNKGLLQHSKVNDRVRHIVYQFQQMLADAILARALIEGRVDNV